ncbi:hypothetical protein [uncultured Variovorax sp.]|uniref:hypothetical protein n=1 Tax=uncultured Variovorax sp. TaxID=114708 RepID=UPI0025CFA1A3|nr:hypothetical protein [uncultured Variovorax sp.]
MNKYFTTRPNGVVSALTETAVVSMDLGARARQEAFNIARARGEHAAPVYSVSVTPMNATMDHATADRLAHAGAAFDIVNGRAVQTARLSGDGYAPLAGDGVL